MGIGPELVHGVAASRRLLVNDAVGVHAGFEMCNRDSLLGRCDPSPSAGLWHVVFHYRIGWLFHVLARNQVRHSVKEIGDDGAGPVEDGYGFFPRRHSRRASPCVAVGFDSDSA